MRFKVETDLHEEYLTFRLIGKNVEDLNENEMVEFFGMILEYVKKYDVKKILINAKGLDYTIFTKERFAIGEYVAKICTKYNIKIAGIRNSKQTDNFTEIVADNRGANVGFFDSKEEAVKWLLD